MALVWQAARLGKGKENFFCLSMFLFYVFSMHCFISSYPFPYICTSYLGHEKEEREEVKSLNATAQKQQPKNEGTIINALSDMNQSYESRKQQNSRASVPFTGITESR